MKALKVGRNILHILFEGRIDRLLFFLGVIIFFAGYTDFPII